MNGLNPDSFSNFWFVVGSDNNITKCAEYFTDYFEINKPIFEALDFIHPVVDKKNNLFQQIDKKIIQFRIASLPFKFRATAHLSVDGIFLICSPSLSSIAEIKDHGLMELMDHPACMTTDLLIMKDIILRHQEEIKKYELEKIEKQLHDQIRINQHQAKLASMGVLAAGVGHEINNPLAIIAGNISVLKIHLDSDNEIDPVVLNSLDKISKGVERISHITKGLRSLSRRDDPKFSHFNFSELAYETIAMILEIFEKDGIQLNIDIANDLYTFGNRGRLQQVLVNLLNNARDAMEKSPCKEIQFLCREVAGQIILTVQDSGSGIPDELKEKIFEPFFTTKDVNKGTGIGLSLINSIISEHDGKISLKTQVGLGTEFTIAIPLSESEVENSEVKEEIREVSVPATAKGTILIVDDEEDISDMLHKVFEGYGLNVITAHDGEDAFKKIAIHHHQLDYIISDMKMPGLDGPGLLNKVKSELNFQGKFYFATGGIDYDIAPFEKDIDGVFTKPFEWDVVFNALFASKKIVA